MGEIIITVLGAAVGIKILLMLVAVAGQKNRAGQKRF